MRLKTIPMTIIVNFGYANGSYSYYVNMYEIGFYAVRLREGP